MKLSRSISLCLKQNSYQENSFLLYVWQTIFLNLNFLTKQTSLCQFLILLDKHLLVTIKQIVICFSTTTYKSLKPTFMYNIYFVTINIYDTPLLWTIQYKSRFYFLFFAPKKSSVYFKNYHVKICMDFHTKITNNFQVKCNTILGL